MHEPKWLQKIHTPHWLTILLGLTILFRIPSFFEPYYYGDEMIYLTLGNAIRKGVTLYSQIYDNKPPLIYILAAIAGNLFWFKVILAFWMVVTLILFWKLTTKLFEREILQKIATITFAILTTIPLLEGNTVNAELFMIGPTIAAFLILLNSPTYKKIFLAGIFFSIATLFKVPGGASLPVIIFYWLITSNLNKKELLEIGKKTLYLMAGFIVPILLTFVWYGAHSALKDYFIEAFAQNLGYLSSFRPGDVQKSFVVRNAPLIMRAWIVVLGLIILRIKSKNLSKVFLLSTIWLLFSLFAATLSERPYPHYLIQAVPSAALLIAILGAFPTIEQALAIVPLFLTILVPVYFKFYYYPTFSYYNRFFSFATHKLTKEQYFNEFDKNVTSNYQTASLLGSLAKPDDKVFVWGSDSPTIYALSRKLPPIKYVASYHINDFSDKKTIANELENKKPEWIIVLSGSEEFPELKNLALKKYILVGTETGANIWHLMGSL